jgi:hypothetical protein
MNSYAAHAMSHVLYESAETDATIAFLRTWLAEYPHDGPFDGHLSWHLALVQMSAGDMDAADRLFDAAFAAEVSYQVIITENAGRDGRI